jgi:hypothetical protein
VKNIHPLATDEFGIQQGWLQVRLESEPVFDVNVKVEPLDAKSRGEVVIVDPVCWNDPENWPNCRSYCDCCGGFDEITGAKQEACGWYCRCGVGIEALEQKANDYLDCVNEVKNDCTQTELRFTKANWNSYQRVLVQGLDDDIYDYDDVVNPVTGESVRMDASYSIKIQAVSVDPLYAGRLETLSGRNSNDDSIGLTVAVICSTDGVQVTSGVETQCVWKNVTTETRLSEGSLTVVLGSEPKSTVLFTVASSNPAEATAMPQILAFTKENWEIAQKVVVTGADDPYIDGDQIYLVRVKTLFTSDPDYKDAMYEYDVNMINMDDPNDRDKTECALGWYGVSPDCFECPAGRFSDTTRDAKTLTACKACMVGLYNDLKGRTSRYTPLNNKIGKLEGCVTCPVGKYNDLSAATECKECMPADRPAGSAPVVCPLASMGPVANEVVLRTIVEEIITFTFHTDEVIEAGSIIILTFDCLGQTPEDVNVKCIFQNPEAVERQTNNQRWEVERAEVPVDQPNRMDITTRRANIAPGPVSLTVQSLIQSAAPGHYSPQNVHIQVHRSINGTLLAIQEEQELTDGDLYLLELPSNATVEDGVPEILAIVDLEPVMISDETYIIGLEAGKFHHWKLLAQNIYTSEFMGVTINETLLQILLLGLVSLIVGMMIFYLSCLSCCAKLKFIDPHHWHYAKESVRAFDSFDEDHSKSKQLQIQSDDKRTLLGGIFTLFFLCLAWSLMGVIFYMYLYYNSLITQALVPKTGEEGLVSKRMVVTAEFIGFTGSCEETWVNEQISITTSGVSSVGGFKTSFRCGPDSNVLFEWECRDCDVTSPNIVFDIIGTDETAVSVTAIKWSLVAAEVTPDENNAVEGAFRIESETVLRGDVPTTVVIALIPAIYSDKMDGVFMSGYRVQYMGEEIGTTQTWETYGLQSTTNQVRLPKFQSISTNSPLSFHIQITFVVEMPLSTVQLETHKIPKLTWLDVWAAAGGLFGAIGATVITMMTMAEIFLIRIAGQRRRDMNEFEVGKKFDGQGGGKKKGNNMGAGGKGMEKGGKGNNMGKGGKGTNMGKGGKKGGKSNMGKAGKKGGGSKMGNATKGGGKKGKVLYDMNGNPIKPGGGKKQMFDMNGNVIGSAKANAGKEEQDELSTAEQEFFLALQKGTGEAEKSKVQIKREQLRANKKHKTLANRVRGDELNEKMKHRGGRDGGRDGASSAAEGDSRKSARGGSSSRASSSRKGSEGGSSRKGGASKASKRGGD